MSRFDQRIHAVLSVAVVEAFSIQQPTAIQSAAIGEILENEAREYPLDIVIRAQTGSGKTLAFLLPLLHLILLSREDGAEEGKPVQGREQIGTPLIILVPTRELAIQTHQMLQRLLAKLRGRHHWIVAGLLSGGDKRKSEKARLRKGIHIVVATPGRLLDHLEATESWRVGSVEGVTRWVVLDEADRLMDMGFGKKIGRILELVNARRPSRQAWARLILCSATVAKDIKEFSGSISLNGPVCFITDGGKGKRSSKEATAQVQTAQSRDSGFAAPIQLRQYVMVPPTKLRLAVLIGLLREQFGLVTAKVVVFFLCCDEVDYFFDLFHSQKQQLLPGSIKISKMHGNLEQSVRQSTFREFTSAGGSKKKDDSNVQHQLLLCTDVAARGLNLERVTCIIQYDAPCDANDYVHRVGRTARQTEQGHSFLLLMPSERPYIERLRVIGMDLVKRRWDDSIEWLRAQTKVNNKSSTKITSKIANEDREAVSDPEDGEAEGDEGIRTMFDSWQKSLEAKLLQSETTDGKKQQRNKRKYSNSKKEALVNETTLGEKPPLKLFTSAQRAFLATVRAYATHTVCEKDIFHIKKLHLGHLAASFCLSQPPKQVSMGGKRHNAKDKLQEAAKKDKKGGDLTDETKPSFQRPQMRKKTFHSSSVSEFGSGDVGNLVRPAMKKAKIFPI